MKTRRIAAVVLFAFLPATISLPAVAQEDASTAQARARFKEGVEAFDKGKYEEARLSFLQAYTLKKHPSVLLNLAQSSAKSGHQLDAARYFQQFLKEATTATPQQKKDAESGLAESRKQIARIDVVAPPGTDISLDEQGKVGTTPFEALDVEPGVHTVKSPVQSITVTAVIGQKVEARLGSVPQAAPVFPAASSSSSSETPANPSSSATANTIVDPDSGKTKHASLFSPPENKIPIYAGLAVAGAGLVSAIVFVAFKADAQSKADTVAGEIRKGAAARGIPNQGACNSTQQGASELANACKTLRDNNNKVDTNATIANVSLVVMGVGLLGAGVWYLFGPKRDDSTPATGTARLPKRPALTPYAGWQSGGLSLAGEF
jgi:hypothetical protein